MKHKIAFLSCLFTATCALLFFRVFTLTVNDGTSAVARRQSSYLVTADSSRGMIYDTNLKPLVNAGTTYKIASNGTPEANAALFEATGKSDLSGTPYITEVEKAVYSGKLTLLECVKRYENTLATHIIGHLDGDKNGVYGIERAYNDYLESLSGRLRVRFHVDGLMRALDSVVPELEDSGYNKKEGIVLTIDSRIQQIVEEEAPKLIKSGAVVVCEVSTGAIRASLSLPDFDPHNVAESLNDPMSPFVNRAFGEHNVGSTFKLAVAALALENGYTEDYTHECKGWVNVSGQVFTCKNHSLPRTLNMTEALEVSCNTYFIDLATELTANRLVGFAKRLCFGEHTLLAENYSASSGYLPSLEELQNPAELANLGFGQGKLLATPVQISSLVSAIANDGNMVYPYIVEGFTNADGTEMKSYTAHFSPQRVMSVATARKLQQMMVSVVEKGSGSQAKPETLSAGGKTASAQTGRFDSDGGEIVDAWFSGFYPAENPKYAIVIVNEGADSGSRYAAPVFKAICDRLYLMEKYG